MKKTWEREITETIIYTNKQLTKCINSFIKPILSKIHLSEWMNPMTNLGKFF